MPTLITRESHCSKDVINMQPCLVLNQLKTDLTILSKSLPATFESTYQFGLKSQLKISVEKHESGVYKLLVQPGPGEIAHANYKKIAGFVVAYAWKAVSTFLAENQLHPCQECHKSGADEILALYQSLHTFDRQRNLPFSSTQLFPYLEHDILSITQQNNRCFMRVETNYIFGHSVKSMVDVQSEGDVKARGILMVADILGEWLRPESIRSFKMPIQELSRAGSYGMSKPLPDYLI